MSLNRRANLAARQNVIAGSKLLVGSGNEEKISEALLSVSRMIDNAMPIDGNNVLDYNQDTEKVIFSDGREYYLSMFSSAVEAILGKGEFSIFSDEGTETNDKPLVIDNEQVATRGKVTQKPRQVELDPNMIAAGKEIIEQLRRAS